MKTSQKKIDLTERNARTRGRVEDEFFSSTPGHSNPLGGWPFEELAKLTVHFASVNEWISENAELADCGPEEALLLERYFIADSLLYGLPLLVRKRNGVKQRIFSRREMVESHQPLGNGRLDQVAAGCKALRRWMADDGAVVSTVADFARARCSGLPKAEIESVKEFMHEGGRGRGHAGWQYEIDLGEGQCKGDRVYGCAMLEQAFVLMCGVRALRKRPA